MSIFNPFKSTPQPRKIQASRPIFQFSSSFIDDDNDLKKPPIPPLPLYHQRSAIDTDGTNDTRSRSRSRLHLILHILNTIFTLTSLSLFITVIPIWNANFQHTRSIVASDYTDGLVLAPLLISLFTSAYIILTEHTPLPTKLRLTNPSSPPTHQSKSKSTVKPKTLILLALTIILLLAITLTLAATSSLALSWQAPVRTSTGQTFCNLANVYSRPCQPVLYQVGELQIGAIVAGGLTWCMWVVILAVRIRDCARERKERERRRMERRRLKRRNGHGRRRGHGHTHGHDSHEKCHQDDRTETLMEKPMAPLPAVSRETLNGRQTHRHKAVSGDGVHGRRADQRHYDLRDIDPTSRKIHGMCTVERPMPNRVGNPAINLASSKGRPKETIQTWLNEKYI